MAARLKGFIAGIVLGALIAFFLGMNFGRGTPLLSNPFAQRDFTTALKGKAGEIADGAREKIHEATRPDGTRRDAR
jgi:hypothetical protein